MMSPQRRLFIWCLMIHEFSRKNLGKIIKESNYKKNKVHVCSLKKKKDVHGVLKMRNLV